MYVDDIKTTTLIKLTINTSQEFSFHLAKLITSRSSRRCPQSVHAFMGHVAGAGAWQGMGHLKSQGPGSRCLMNSMFFSVLLNVHCRVWMKFVGLSKLVGTQQPKRVSKYVSGAVGL